MHRRRNLVRIIGISLYSHNELNQGHVTIQEIMGQVDIGNGT